MKINKDFAEAAMMVSFISLVLIWTSDFDNETTKQIYMIALGVVTVVMGILRYLPSRQKEDQEVSD